MYTKRRRWGESTSLPAQRAGGRCEPVWGSVCILAPEPPSRTASSRDGRVIPLQVQALLEAVERVWVTIRGIRVVPRNDYAPDSCSQGRFLMLSD